MVKRRSKVKRVPVVKSWQPVRSKKRARTVTSQYHNLSAKLKEARQDQTGASSERAENIERKLEELGGLRVYQEASVLTTSQNRSTSRWIFKVLREIGVMPVKGEAPLKLLEVGAINTHLVACKWLDVRAIDLNSSTPQIEQMDFFDLEPQANSYDVVVEAMVLNFVPSALQELKHNNLLDMHI